MTATTTGRRGLSAPIAANGCYERCAPTPTANDPHWPERISVDVPKPRPRPSAIREHVRLEARAGGHTADGDTRRRG